MPTIEDEDRRQFVGRRESDEDIKIAHLVREQAVREVAVLRDDIERLRTAGDKLANKLRRAPGIDVMRSTILDEWQDAKDKSYPKAVFPRAPKT